LAIIEYDAKSTQAQEYRNLAEAIDNNEMFAIPKPMEQERLEEILLEYGLMDAIKNDYRI
jgi:nitrogenase iron protein NifH